MNLTERRYMVPEVAEAADLHPDTVVDWRQRGLVRHWGWTSDGHPGVSVYTPADDGWTKPPDPDPKGPCSAEEALQLAAIRALVDHLMPVHRSAEIMDRATGLAHRGWAGAVKECINGSKHVYVFVVHKRDSKGDFDVHLMATPSLDVTAIMQHFSAKRGEDGSTVAPGYNPVAVFDIGPDILRAMDRLNLKNPK